MEHYNAASQYIDADFSLFLSSAEIVSYQQRLHELVSHTLTERERCDLELILNGAFQPLTGFLTQKNYMSVLQEMTLQEGTLWPMPIMLSVRRDIAEKLQPQQEIALRDAEGLLLAILAVEDVWAVDKNREAAAIFGTLDQTHPGVNYLQHQTEDFYVGGKIKGISLPHHYDFNALRYTPQQLKTLFAKEKWQKIVAFQTRNPMHRAHQELTLRAMQQTNAKLLLHPVVGMTKPGDIDYYTRVRCYEHVLATYPQGSAMLSLLPLAMRMGGPREAIWHAIIRRNYGCTHFIVGRDHAGPGKNKQGENFYDPYAAQQLAMQYQKEIGIEILPFQEMVYSEKKAHYFSLDEFPVDETPAAISGTELRMCLQHGKEIPEWFSYPAVIAELRKAYPLRQQQGFTIFMTGLPSSGKSTLANALSQRLRELTTRKMTVLDGDVVRTQLSQGLGFSKKDREINIKRVGYVAREITKHGGIAISALVAPYQEAREAVREMVSEVGGFIEVYVATPLATCEERDRKGFYQQARAGHIKQFTGISDPYEEPSQAEIKIDTSMMTPYDSLELLVKQIKLLGYL